VSSWPVDELMAIAMSRRIQDGDFLSHGAGVPLAAAAMMLAKSLHAPNLDFFYQGTITPRENNPAKLLLDMLAIYRSAPAFMNQADIMSFELRGRGDFQFLRPAQIDAVGNINTSLIGTLDNPKMRFHGIASGDAMCLVKRVCLYTTEHTTRVFPEKLDYVTGVGHRDAGRWRTDLDLPGGGPAYVITPMACFDFEGPDRRMRLVEMMPGHLVDEVKRSTGFELAIASDVSVFEPKDLEVETLRRLDPLRTRRMEFREWRDQIRERLAAERAAQVH
jgi:glutaconate CoA-transferase, subunit B